MKKRRRKIRRRRRRGRRKGRAQTKANSMIFFFFKEGIFCSLFFPLFPLRDIFLSFLEVLRNGQCGGRAECLCHQYVSHLSVKLSVLAKVLWSWPRPDPGFWAQSGLLELVGGGEDSPRVISGLDDLDNFSFPFQSVKWPITSPAQLHPSISEALVAPVTWVFSAPCHLFFG